MRLVEDLKGFSDGSKLKLISTIIINPSFHSVFLYRLSHFIGKVKFFVIFSKIIMYVNRVIFTVDIDYRADFAGGFVLVHGLGTVIGKGVKTEGPVKIYQGVTLGGNNNKRKVVKGREFSQPWLMSGIIVYANSTIVGPVLIGEGSIIGANSIVTKDVENNQIFTVNG